MKPSEFTSLLKSWIAVDTAPVVIHSAVWPFAAIWRLNAEDVCSQLLDCILAAAGPGRDILMPTFTPGYHDGFLDLDAAPSTTGLLSEAFRRSPGSRRTLSAFFSFAAQGPSSLELTGLRPEEAWGEGSLYAWMEERNAHFVTLGVHPTHVSYYHRYEWLFRHRITYRTFKTTTGIVRHQGRNVPLKETLFVRSLDPEAENDFTTLLPLFTQSSQLREKTTAPVASHMRAQAALCAVQSAFESNPHFVLKNPQDFPAFKP